MAVNADGKSYMIQYSKPIGKVIFNKPASEIRGVSKGPSSRRYEFNYSTNLRKEYMPFNIARLSGEYRANALVQSCIKNGMMIMQRRNQYPEYYRLCVQNGVLHAVDDRTNCSRYYIINENENELHWVSTSGNKKFVWTKMRNTHPWCPSCQGRGTVNSVKCWTCSGVEMRPPGASGGFRGGAETRPGGRRKTQLWQPISARWNACMNCGGNGCHYCRGNI